LAVRHRVLCSIKPLTTFTGSSPFFGRTGHS
jgi:hypothetical protein